jgi:hypothetical protein
MFMVCTNCAHSCNTICMVFTIRNLPGRLLVIRSTLFETTGRRLIFRSQTRGAGAVLINQTGIEGVEEVVDLDSRRPNTNFDPKTRVTMTTLLQVALTSFAQPDAPSTSCETTAAIASVTSVPTDHSTGAQAHADVA